LWPQVRDTFSDGMPAPVRAVVSRIARRDVRNCLHGHGLGRHSRDEIIDLGRADLASVAAFLGDRPYFMGGAPTSVDAVVYAMLANTLSVPLDSPLREAAASHPALVAYCERMRQRYFPEPKIGRSWSPPADVATPQLRSVG
jgi:glutathione S-transferase